MNNSTVLILGGDKRMVILADILSQEMNSYLCYNSSLSTKNAKKINSVSELRKIDMVVMPIPSFDKNGYLNGCSDLSAEELFSLLPCNTLIFGAKISALHKHIAKEYGHRLIDYGENEKFNMYNAIPTAEGAIMLAMENSEYTVHGSSYIVIGYGRIGKILSKTLRELGGNVTIASRNEKSLSLAECEGYSTVSMKDFCVAPPSCNICFNTVPSIILSEKETKNWECDKYIELASAPGGLSEKAVFQLKDRYISALALPGRYFPITSGKIIYKTIKSMLSSTGEM